MQDKPTQVTTEDEARQVLLAEQVREGGIETIPASDQTIETEAGWAFFNVNGYLGTVTPEGDVIAKDELAEDEPPFLDLPDDGGEER
jgi:hypothetical protein